MSTDFTHQFHTTILREYDIRGIIDETLFPTDAYAIGRCFATLMRENGNDKVCVGYDGRASSPKLEEQLIQGLTDSGVHVIRVGMGPTPMLYYATYALETANGIMITGSHNPPSHNGFKMILNGKPFFGADIQKIGPMVANGAVSEGSATVSDHPMLDEYVTRILKDYIYPSEFTVVWDCGNGVTGDAVKKVVKELPGRHVLLFEEIDSTFPNHHPDPTVADNLQDLIRTVKGLSADFGVAFDGDGDRIGVVDSRGNIIWGDQLLAILSREVLAENPGAAIIADVKASKLLFDEIDNLGGQPVMWKTGHSLIKTKMAELSAPLAGEMSGHIFYNDHYYGYDDALYVGVRLLNLLGNIDDSLEDMLDALPTAINTPEIRFPCPDEQKFSAVDQVKQQVSDDGYEFSDVDGVRVTFEGGWWLLRASNTQAVLVARCEAPDEARLKLVKEDLRQHLTKAGLDCPTF